MCERADAMFHAGSGVPGHDGCGPRARRRPGGGGLQPRADEDVWVANYNAPGQVVIAGSPEGVAKATEHVKERRWAQGHATAGVGTFHTPFMAPARDRLRKAIAEANPRDTDVPIVSNVDALPHANGAEW
ncbi:MAG: hypothetical protein R2715_16465 [Ilumatobacteraceae bacterium]